MADQALEAIAPCFASDCNGVSDVFCGECGAPVCGACSQREAIGCCIVSGKPDDRKEWKRRAEAAEALLNAPEIVDFAKAVQLEAAHQRARWGSDHDAGKADADWFWLLGYLGGKALRTDDGIEKQLHRIITVAAAACNWHAAKLGQTNMRPGIETPAGEETSKAEARGDVSQGPLSPLTAVRECAEAAQAGDATAARSASPLHASSEPGAAGELPGLGLAASEPAASDELCDIDDLPDCLIGAVHQPHCRHAGKPVTKGGNP